MKSLSRSILSLSLLMVFLCACQVKEPVPTITLAPTIATVTSAVEPTMTETVLPSVTVEPTATVIPPILENDVPPGEYIFFSGWSLEGDAKTYVYSIDDGSLILIAKNELLLISNKGDSIYRIGNPPKKKHLFTLFPSDQPIELPVSCNYFDLSRNGQFITTALCDETISPDGGIGVYDIYSNQYIHLIPKAIGENTVSRQIGFAQFSPNGDWISFLDVYTSNEYEEENGLYLLPTSCLTESKSCLSTVIGPYSYPDLNLYPSYYSYSWSPDSQKILIANRAQTDIVIFSLDDESLLV